MYIVALPRSLNCLPYPLPRVDQPASLRLSKGRSSKPTHSSISSSSHVAKSFMNSPAPLNQEVNQLEHALHDGKCSFSTEGDVVEFRQAIIVPVRKLSPQGTNHALEICDPRTPYDRRYANTSARSINFLDVTQERTDRNNTSRDRVAAFESRQHKKWRGRWFHLSSLEKLVSGPM
jgi:hypothetical protein